MFFMSLMYSLLILQNFDTIGLWHFVSILWKKQFCPQRGNGCLMRQTRNYDRNLKKQESKLKKATMSFCLTTTVFRQVGHSLQFYLFKSFYGIPFELFRAFLGLCAGVVICIS